MDGQIEMSQVVDGCTICLWAEQLSEQLWLQRIYVEELCIAQVQVEGPISAVAIGLLACLNQVRRKLEKERLSCPSVQTPNPADSVC